ncbi:RBR-type E3 ubiquitin transferase [Ranunculus cassubicifolius]
MEVDGIIYIDSDSDYEDAIDDQGDFSDEYNDEDDQDQSDDQELISSSNLKCQVITKESLLAAQRDDLRRVMEMLNLPEQHARTLLIHHRWNVENLLEVLVEKGKDRLCALAGVTVMEKGSDGHSGVTSKEEDLTCYICMEDGFAKKDITRMDCGHCFCNTCWTEHFIVKINEGQSRRIQCMAYKCNAVCDEAIVRDLVNERDKNLAERFERFLLESYIDDNKLVKWCPSVPHCGNAIRVNDSECCEVECVCGNQFCFNCSSEAHSPCSCLMWDLWCKKSKAESETINYMTKNTKPCPKCGKPCEKNGGCNLVRCICRQPFCWLCGAATGTDHTWISIKGHSCGRYKEDREKKDAYSKRDLYRYMHYHNRYKAHIDSFKLETKLKESIQEKIIAIENKYSTLNDHGWLNDALYRLFKSRRILSYSYAFAYYMFGNMFSDELTKEELQLKQNLFEDQQQQFESNIETLSKWLEEPFDEYEKAKIVEMRLQVINICVITDTRCKGMYECIDNDLLGSLQTATHYIAPYKSKGIDKAVEVPKAYHSGETEELTKEMKLQHSALSTLPLVCCCSTRNKLTRRIMLEI